MVMSVNRVQMQTSYNREHFQSNCIKSEIKKGAMFEMLIGANFVRVIPSLRRDHQTGEHYRSGTFISVARIILANLSKVTFKSYQFLGSEPNP